MFFAPNFICKTKPKKFVAKPSGRTFNKNFKTVLCNAKRFLFKDLHSYNLVNYDPGFHFWAEIKHEKETS